MQQRLDSSAYRSRLLIRRPWSGACGLTPTVWRVMSLRGAVAGSCRAAANVAGVTRKRDVARLSAAMEDGWCGKSQGSEQVDQPDWTWTRLDSD